MFFEYLILLLVFILPAIFVFIAKVVGAKVGIKSYNLWVNILASYGIYSVVIIVSSIHAPFDHYMVTNCAPIDDVTLPCSLWLYKTNDFFLEHLFTMAALLAFMTNVFYLIKIGPKVALNKRHHTDSQ